MKELAQILIGSQNYNLDGPDSDFDYKVIMMPEFEDLYNNKQVSKADLPSSYDPEHYSVMDARTFAKRLYEGNFNAIELVFSTMYTGTGEFIAYLNDAMSLYSKGYVWYVWNNFTRVVKALIYNSFDRYGINRKTASRAIFMTNFIKYIADNNFVISGKTWSDPKVWKYAREVRFNEAIPLPTKEELEENLERVLAVADWKRTVQKMPLIKGESLLNRMKDMIFISIKEGSFYDTI